MFNGQYEHKERLQRDRLEKNKPLVAFSGIRTEKSDYLCTLFVFLDWRCEVASSSASPSY